MKKIIHVSDIHASTTPLKGQSRQFLERLKDAFLADIQSLEGADSIIFSGDLTYSGKMEEFELCQKEIIVPIRDALRLDNKDILLVPGNHDTDWSGFSFSTKLAIKSLRKEHDSGGIAELQAELLSGEKKPYAGWLDFTSKFYEGSQSVVEIKDFYQTYKHGNVGIACLNTGWSAIGEGDRENLFIGERQLDAAMKSISGFKEKVIIMHHPMEWLHPEERRLLSAKITNFKVSTIFYGHMHEFNILRESSFSEDFVMKMQAGRFDLSGTEKSGYSIISANHTNNLKSGRILFRRYDEAAKKFAPWVDRCPQGQMDYEAALSGGFNREAFAEDCSKVLDRFDYDLMCNTGVAEAERKRLSEIFICPAIKVEGYEIEEDGEEQYIGFEELTKSRDNFLLVGGENSGKSTILKSLLMNKLRSQAQAQLDEIAFYFDCKGKKLPSKNRIKAVLTEIYDSLPGSALYIDTLNNKTTTENALLIFDGVEGLSQRCIDELIDFLKEYKAPRFIISCKHATAHEIATKLRTEVARKFFEVNIGGMKRSHLKGLVGRWLSSSTKQNSVAREILKAVDNAGMPNNLFVYSMLLSIYERKQGHFSTYLHEADLVENFIEVIMHKHCITVERAPQYKDLLRLLGSIAHEMVCRNTFALKVSEVDALIVQFNGDIAQDFQVASYLNPILASGVIELSEGRYRFSQACFFDYVYARYLSNRSTSYTELHNSINFLRFNKVIEYISAISKEDTALLEFCQKLTADAWEICVASEKISDLKSAAQELQEAAQSDILDELKVESIDKALAQEPPKEHEIDDRMDSENPLRECPQNGESRATWDDLHGATLFQSSLSLYARVFRAAEHVTDRSIADQHFSSALDFYQKTIALNTRRFQEKLRPIVLEKLARHSKYQELPQEHRKKATERFDAFLNFLIAAFPNFAVSMMTADLVNSRQISRLREKRADSVDNLEKIIITYALCEIDGVDTLGEIKSLKPSKSYEYSTVIMKILELSHMDFTLSQEVREELIEHAKSLMKNKLARKLVNDLSEISTKITGELLGLES
ncbi:metallophosphoesterase [Pseudomonas sp. WMBT8]|uniref:metallophosphoesterase n=1 Tax=Pseudomonas sp. WMBT8 TaxID=3414496 RepID=UPI003D806D95